MKAPRLPPGARVGRRLVLVVFCLLWAAPSGAGHELPFYPSYYPQEIRLEALPPAAAAPLLRAPSSTPMSAPTPSRAGRAPADVKPLESLGGYVVMTFNPASPLAASRESRCEAARRISRSLGAAPGLYVPHPYPVTPYHMDYLEHFDLAQSARQAYAAAPSGSSVALRFRPKARWPSGS